MMKPVVTRFRAYQLGSAGSSFSYSADGHFTLIEARLTDTSLRSLLQEMKLCGVSIVDTLHITSWDADHCAEAELPRILRLFRPRRIECPGYDPHTDTGKACQALIRRYRSEQAAASVVIKVQPITPEYIDSLETLSELAFRNVFLHPRWLDPDCANDNSTVKLFRAGSFNVLSLGDVEDPRIAAALRTTRCLTRETDVMIVAHHGADNGFTTKRFLAALDPKLAICSSNYDNMYSHPRQEIRELLYERGIRLMTTKTGDVIVRSIGAHTGKFQAINLKADSSEVSSSCEFTSKKSGLLAHNDDTVRQLFARRTSYPR